MGQTTGNAYLSGWEYNRLLQQHAATPRTSALPAASLWKGAHQFWLFKHVLCTSESIENECDAADALGWATGSIIRELIAEGIIQSVDWAQLPKEVTERLEATHTLLRGDYPEDAVRRFIQQGDVVQLENIKNRLLKPVLDHYHARASGAPNSLGTWVNPNGPAGSTQRRSGIEIEKALTRLAEPVVPGFNACNEPGTGLPPEVLEQQRRVQLTVEGPLIATLIAGDGPFAGRRGHLPYFDELQPHRDAYQPINEQILRDWRANRDRLYRLREVAESHLWEPLHGEWLPALDSGQMKPETFKKKIELAIKAGPLLRFLDTKPVRTLVGVIPVTALSLSSLGGAALATSMGADPTMSDVIGAAAVGVAEASRKVLAPTADSLRTSTRLAVFYQQTR